MADRTGTTVAQILSDVEGRRAWAYEFGIDTCLAGDWVVLATPGKLATLTLLHVERATAGSSATVQPDIYTDEGAPTDTIRHEGHESAAAARIRNQTGLRLYASKGQIWIYPRPDATCTRLLIRAVLVEGHAPGGI